MFDAYPEAITCKEIADNGNIELKKVVDALNHYTAGNYSYITRLKKKSKSSKYRYKINKSGVVAYLQYKHRIEHGFDLNRHRRVPKRVDSYYGATKKGSPELGLGADSDRSSMKPKYRNKGHTFLVKSEER